MEFVRRTRDLGTITSATTSADLKLEDDGPGLIPVAITVYPRSTGSPALGGANGLKLQFKGEANSVAQDKSATTDVTTALTWKTDDIVPVSGVATWDGTPDGSSTVGLFAVILYRTAQLRADPA